MQGSELVLVKLLLVHRPHLVVRFPEVFEARLDRGLDRVWVTGMLCEHGEIEGEGGKEERLRRGGEEGGRGVRLREGGIEGKLRRKRNAGN